ncbi:MAG: Ig-like domain-containing protein [Acidimicrobiia bacterium]|nr:Ig-like domain-containing protein [Acidimicrobiia bacterium]
MRTALNRRTGALAAVLVLAAMLAPTAVSAQTGAPSYSILSIGEQIPGATAGAALAVNESSDTVGYAVIGSATWNHVPFVYTAEHGATLLPRPAWAVTARARDVSDRHADGTVDIVGWAADSIYSGDLAVRWKYSTDTGEVIEMVELGTLNGLPQSQATNVNAIGDVVGYSGGFMQFDGPATLFTDVGPELISDAFLYGLADVTDSRWVLVKGAFGAASANRYNLTAGTTVDIGVPPGLYTSTGVAMNESLQVAATATTGDTDPRGQYISQVWRFSEGAGWKYIAGGGSSIDHARGINNRGDVIAQIVAGLTYYDLLYVDSIDAVFIIENLLGPGFEGTWIGDLNDINDRGDIATSAPGGPALLVPIGELQPPPAPDGLTATPHPATQQQPFISIDLAWTSLGPLAQGYSVERALANSGAFSEIGTTTSMTSHRDMFITAGVTYDYRVRALGAGGFSPYSDIVTATAPEAPPEPPPAPAGLTATPQPSFDSIDLAWTGSGPLAQEYSVERALAGSGSFAEISATTVTTYRDVSVAPGVTYDYRVRAIGEAGFSPYSNVATATAPQATADTEPPTVDFVTPADGSTLKRTRRVSVTVSVADPGGVQSIRIVAVGPTSSEICDLSVDGPTSTDATCSWNTRRVGYGDYTLTATASDAFGNVASTSISVSIVRRRR